MKFEDVFTSLLTHLEKDQFSLFKKQLEMIPKKSFEYGLILPLLKCKAKLKKRERFLEYLNLNTQ